MGKLIGYARVSTRKQDVRSQWKALVEAGVPQEAIHVENASGAAPRPVLARVVLRLQQGDTLVVSSFDRIGRNLHDMTELVGILEEKGASLRSLREDLRTEGAAGKLLTHLLMAIAEWEREAIRERVQMGLAAARSRGVKFGPKPKLTPVEKRAALAWRNEGLSVSEVAQRLKVSMRTVQRAIREVSKTDNSRRAPGHAPVRAHRFDKL